MKKRRQNGQPRPLPDYLRKSLQLVLVGCNPGLRSARLGHYYAGRGNQFWPLVSQSGLVREPITYAEDARLLDLGIGLTDIVKRPSRAASDLDVADYRKGREVLKKKIRRYHPQVVAFVGKGVYEKFSHQHVRLGPQPERFFGARVFVLPSTSGLNASMSRPQKLRYFRRLARWVNRDSAKHRTGRNSVMR